MTKSRGSIWWRQARSLLSGVSVGAICLGPARGGDSIIFSAPKQEAELPARKDALDNLLKPSLRLDRSGPDLGTPPPINIPLDPLTQKRLRQRQEDQRNWLLSEPALFKDRFPDPFTRTKTDSEEGTSALDRSANRLFGKPDLKESEKNKADRPLYTGTLDDLSSDKDSNTQARPGSTSGRREAGDRDRDPKKDSRPNSPEAAMKALFGPKESSDNQPSIPGLSWNGSSDPAEAKILKRELQQKRDDFQRFLSPPGQIPGGGIIDPINSLQDLTRTPAYPVAPSANGLIPSSRSPLEPLGPLSPDDRLARPGRSVDDLSGYRQSPVSQPAPDNKLHQLESLNLMSRPSVLALPGRPF